MIDDVTGTILNYMSENAPHMLVMGGYGYSRFREIVLGGATRGMLQSMNSPNTDVALVRPARSTIAAVTIEHWKVALSKALS